MLQSITSWATTGCGGLKVLVWSRGGLSPSRPSLVENGPLGQCVSFSSFFIDVGRGFTAYVVFLFSFCFNHFLVDSWLMVESTVVSTGPD